MYVPNYIPQPLEVPGNVSLETWGAKLSFLRRVTAWHLLTVAMLVGFCFCPLPVVPIIQSLALLGGALLVLCLVRIVTRGTTMDMSVSVALLATVLVPLAMVTMAVQKANYPVWAPLTGLAATTLYTAFCGRDFSFVGQYLLSLIASEVALGVLAPILHMTPTQAGWAMGIDAVFLTYFCYDLASLMSRRRSNEAAAAAVDLYRDVLNVFGWIIRCIRHWKRHRIWTVPWA